MPRSAADQLDFVQQVVEPVVDAAHEVEPAEPAERAQVAPHEADRRGQPHARAVEHRAASRRRPVTA